jgi:hypothetical protein
MLFTTAANRLRLGPRRLIVSTDGGASDHDAQRRHPSARTALGRDATPALPAAASSSCPIHEHAVPRQLRDLLIFNATFLALLTAPGLYACALLGL